MEVIPGGGGASPDLRLRTFCPSTPFSSSFCALPLVLLLGEQHGNGSLSVATATHPL